MKRLDRADPRFDDDLAALLVARQSGGASVAEPVAAIIRAVRAEGDAALVRLTREYDRVELTPRTLRVSAAEIAAAASGIAPELAAALDLAARRIEAFHRAQLPHDIELADADGLRAGLRWTPLDAVGIYVPGGKAAYPSSVLMNAIPARVAGVGRIAMCVPSPGGAVPPLVLAAAHRVGIDEIYRVGGAQAVAALAYGTATIAPVDRITGPGNAYVAEAKRQVFGRVGIDSVAGPSEVVIIADASADPRAIALDLLAQAEHDEDAQSVLVTWDPPLADAVAAAVEAELPTLGRAAIARASWERHGAIVRVRDAGQAVELSNRLAPEHLQIVAREAAGIFARIRHAGAVFLGAGTPEAIGDYVGGPNHVLPTGGTARFSSGLSVHDFIKRTTWLECSPAGLAAVGPAAVALAEAEGLGAHARSVAFRLGQG